MKRRFMEIIDSEDETNGNGSRMNRKRFNTRDVFGDAFVEPIVEANIDEEN